VHLVCFIIRIYHNSRSHEHQTHTPNLIKIRPVAAELFHADGQRDMTQLIVALSNFLNAPEKTVFRFWIPGSKQTNKQRALYAEVNSWMLLKATLYVVGRQQNANDIRSFILIATKPSACISSRHIFPRGSF